MRDMSLNKWWALLFSCEYKNGKFREVLRARGKESNKRDGHGAIKVKKVLNVFIEYFEI
jgi:hypothetical protein